MAAAFGLIEAAQLEPVDDESGNILEVLAVVLGELGPRLGVENAQGADLVAGRCNQREPRVKADFGRPLNQRVGGKPLVLARVANQEEAIVLDGIGAKTTCTAYSGRLHAEARFEEQALLADQRQRSHGRVVHTGGELDQPIKIDVGPGIEYAIFVKCL